MESKNKTCCDRCGKELVVGEWPWCPHGRGVNNVVDDTILGGEVNENVSHEPVHFDSKSAKRRYLKEHGLQEFVRHVHRPDGKKPDTTRWI
jgi:hypothetical protein